MARNFGWVQGEVGKVNSFTLTYEDAAGVEQPFPLSNKTVFLRAWREDPAIRTIDDEENPSDAECDVTGAADGEGTFTTNATTALLSPGEHFYRFKTVDEEDPPNVRFFPYDPDDEEASYGLIIVRAAH